nr:hypothetical protein [Allomuricauda sp.]
MRPTILVLLLAMLLSACSPIRNLQKVEARIPCLGSVGKERTKLLSKNFEKIGEPLLQTSLEVSLNAFEFSKATLGKYTKHQEAQAHNTTPQYADSTSPPPTAYYQLRISDLVELKAQLNANHNETLREYLQDDMELSLLTGISFVTDGVPAQELNSARHFYLKDDAGALVLVAHNEHRFVEIPMFNLDVFDFETSHLCWKHNNRSQLEVAAIIPSGSRCPGETKKDPIKLDNTKTYLKL